MENLGETLASQKLETVLSFHACEVLLVLAVFVLLSLFLAFHLCGAVVSAFVVLCYSVSFSILCIIFIAVRVLLPLSVLFCMVLVWVLSYNTYFTYEYTNKIVQEADKVLYENWKHS